MKLKADHPRVREVAATFQRDKDDISIAGLAVYEARTGKRLEWNLSPTTNIISADKAILLLSTVYSEFQNDIPIDKISTQEEASNFFSRIAFHAAERLIKNEKGEVNDLLVVVELMLKDGTEETRSFIISFLEDFQTIFFNENLDFQILKPNINPLTMQMWEQIDHYWKEAAAYNKSQTGA